MKISHPLVRFLLMVLGTAVLLFALWGGLYRIGWNMPGVLPGLAAIHGPLIVCGFVGSYLSLERAAALKSGVAEYLPTALIVSGAVALMARPDARINPVIITVGSLGYVIVCLALFRRERTHHAAFNAIGSVQWLVGNLIWCAGWPVFNVTLWWMSFILFSIAGQRLQLTRMMHQEPKWEWFLLAALFTVFAGHVAMALGVLHGDESMMEVVGDAIYDPRIRVGMRVAGVGLLLAAAWFLRFDLPRNALKRPGIARYIAVCLLSSYGWLAVAGLLSLRYAGLMLGMVNDASLHAFFLGFLFFMVIGHGPILAPSLLGLNVTMRTWYYLQVVVLNVSLALRVGGDVAASAAMRRAGAMGNFAAVAFFVASLAWALYADNSFRRVPPEAMEA